MIGQDVEYSRAATMPKVRDRYRLGSLHEENVEAIARALVLLSRIIFVQTH